MQETQVQSLGWEDPLEKRMATHSSILAWEIPWTEEPSGLQSMGLQRLGHNLATKLPPASRSSLLNTLSLKTKKKKTFPLSILMKFFKEKYSQRKIEIDFILEPLQN